MLILASESPRRRELLGRLGIPFETEPAAIGEIDTLPDPREVPLRNAERKAAAIAARRPGDLVLGSDTVIVAGNRVIGKPRDEADALDILLTLAGTTHEVITGLALMRESDGFRKSWTETTFVTFKPFGRAEAQRYLSLVPVLDKAGAYAIQEHGDLIVDHIEGSLENVIGLPLGRLQKELVIL